MKKLAFLILTFAVTASATINFDLMHTKPECPETSSAARKKSITFCSISDSRRLAEKAGMEKKVIEILNQARDPQKAEITIAYFSFSNSVVKNKLCEMGKAGFKINGFFDSSNNVNSIEPTAVDSFPRQLSKCQGPQGKNVVIKYLGSKDTTVKPIVWRLHHNKFLVVKPDTDQQRVFINFSSGNLSAFGLSAHFDHWVMAETTTDTNFYQQHSCVIKALRSAVEDSDIDNPKKYRTTLDRCLQKTLWSKNPNWIEDAISDEGVAPLFAPNPDDQIYTVLVNQINSVVPGGRIYGAMQHFTRTGIAAALKRAVDRGVKVTLLMDDDIVSGESNVPGVREFYDDQLKPAGIEIRFMQTNASDKQMMHNKFLVLEGFKTKNRTRIFSGAGHFTTSGMKNNYENFYVTEVDSLTEKYKDLFNYMLKNSLTERQAGPPPDAEPLPAVEPADD